MHVRAGRTAIVTDCGSIKLLKSYPKMAKADHAHVAEKQSDHAKATEITCRFKSAFCFYTLFSAILAQLADALFRTKDRESRYVSMSSARRREIHLDSARDGHWKNRL